MYYKAVGGVHNWNRKEGVVKEDGLDFDAHLLLMAGIEANIPVTYGIGSQRRDQSTGCQFIGQSPVHSILAAC